MPKKYNKDIVGYDNDVSFFEENGKIFAKLTGGGEPKIIPVDKIVRGENIADMIISGNTVYSPEGGEFNIPLPIFNKYSINPNTIVEHDDFNNQIFNVYEYTPEEIAATTGGNLRDRGYPSSMEGGTTPVSAVEAAQQSRNSAIESAVGFNEATPVSAVEAAQQSRNSAIESAVGFNEATPLSAVEAAQQSRNSAIESAVGFNKATPVSAVEAAQSGREQAIEASRGSNILTPTQTAARKTVQINGDNEYMTVTGGQNFNTSNDFNSNIFNVDYHGTLNHEEFYKELGRAVASSKNESEAYSKILQSGVAVDDADDYLAAYMNDSVYNSFANDQYAFNAEEWQNAIENGNFEQVNRIENLDDSFLHRYDNIDIENMTSNQIKSLADEALTGLRESQNILEGSIAGAFVAGVERGINDAIGLVDQLANHIVNYLDPTLKEVREFHQKKKDYYDYKKEAKEHEDHYNKETLPALEKKLEDKNKAQEALNDAQTALDNANTRYAEVSADTNPNDPTDEEGNSNPAYDAWERWHAQTLYYLGIEVNNASKAFEEAQTNFDNISADYDKMTKDAEEEHKKLDEEIKELEKRLKEFQKCQETILRLYANCKNAKIFTKKHKSNFKTIAAGNSEEEVRAALAAVRSDYENTNYFPTMLPLSGYYEGERLVEYEPGMVVTHNDGYPYTYVVEKKFDPSTGCVTIAMVNADGTKGEPVNIFDPREIFPVKKLVEDEYSTPTTKQWIIDNNPQIDFENGTIKPIETQETTPVTSPPTTPPKPEMTKVRPDPTPRPSPTIEKGEDGIVGTTPGTTPQPNPTPTPNKKERDNDTPIVTNDEPLNTEPPIDVGEALNPGGPGIVEPSQFSGYGGTTYGENPSPIQAGTSLYDAAPNTGLDRIYATEENSKGSVGFGALAGLAIGAAGLGISGLAASKDKDKDEENKDEYNQNINPNTGRQMPSQNTQQAMNGLYGMYGMSNQGPAEKKPQNLVFNNDGSYTFSQDNSSNNQNMY